MTRIDCETGVTALAAIVSQALEAAGVRAVLSGGAAVSIYSNNQYQSFDLDFVTEAEHSEIGRVLAGLGFTKGKDRYYRHSENAFFLEFPAGPLAVGDQIIQDSFRLETPHGAIRILSATQCVMDRLAAFYHWNDRQALDQAVLVCRSQQNIEMRTIENWSRDEGMQEKFSLFVRRVQ